MMGNISFRVRAENFDQAMAALHNLADDVRSESTSGQDVTEEYVDLNARLTNLQAAEAQLLKLMEQAGDVSDILAVQQELVQTRGEIEQTKGRMQYLEQSAAMSLIQVTWSSPSSPSISTPIPEECQGGPGHPVLSHHLGRVRAIQLSVGLRGRLDQHRRGPVPHLQVGWDL